MKIQFDQIPENVIPRFRGGEGTARTRMYTGPGCKIMRARLEPGSSIGLHTHETSSEVIYLLSGEGKVLFDGGGGDPGPGGVPPLPPGPQPQPCQHRRGGPGLLRRDPGVPLRGRVSKQRRRSRT